MPRQINFEQIHAKLLKSKRVRENLDNRMALKVEEAKQELVKEFLEHPVSQELLNPENGNISKTLDGKDNKSLFGFIGFEAGSDPVMEVVGILEEEVKLVGSKIVDSKTIAYKIRHPSLKDIYAKTPLPWEGGRSWVYGISHGISGFGHFLSGFFQNLGVSRSGQGIQVEQDVRSETFKPRKDYIEAMIRKFRAKFGKGAS